jgi:hypothetical protein
MRKTRSNRTRQLIISLVVISLLAGLSAAVLATRPQPDPFKGEAITDPPFTPITYSIQAFLWWDEGQTGVHLDWTEHILGFTHVKQTFPWREMEPRPGEWDFSQSDRILNELEARNLQAIVRLGQTPVWATAADEVSGDYEKHDAPPDDIDAWRNYCGTVAERYSGRVAAYQIWNEPNLSREWGNQRPDAAAYVELLAACSEAIRAVDDSAILISAGLSPTIQQDDNAIADDVYLDAMYRADFQQYIDVVGVHAPGYGQPPSYGPDDAVADGRNRAGSFRRVEDLRKIMLLYDDAARQMAILEFGWTTDTENQDYAWHAVTEEQQGDYIVAAYEYVHENWRPWVGLMSLIYLPNPDWTPADEEAWWALAAPDGRLRPAFFDIAGMDRYCGATIVEGWPPGVSEEVYLEHSIACP